MNTNNIDNERTQYDTNLDERTQIDNNANERTQLDNNERTEHTENKENKEQRTTAAPSQPIKKGPKVGRILGGAAAGIALGAAATVLSSGTPVDGEEAHGGEEVPTWSDGQVSVAHGVNDDMSFTEAFNTARTEVGPGGAFEWHGNIYHTYNKDEWDNMSAEDKAAFGQHFNFTGSATAQNDEVEVVDSHASHTAAHTAAHTTGHTTGHATAHAQTASAETAQSQHTSEETAQTQPTGQGHQGDEPNYVNGGEGNQGHTEIINVPPQEDEVTILGVEHDENTGFTYAQLSVNGHEGIMVDIDGDNEYDILAVDFNGNGQPDDDEFIALSNGSLDEFNIAQHVAAHQGQTTETVDVDDPPVDYGEPLVMAQNDEVAPQIDEVAPQEGPTSGEEYCDATDNSLPNDLGYDCASEQPTDDLASNDLMV